MNANPNPMVPEEDDLSDVLAPGTLLFHGQYKIESFLSSGGFGVTYLARDSLDRQVVIKECFPRSLCIRDKNNVLSRPRTPRDDFHSIVRLFVQEARNLAKLKHPNIVGVHQIFEDNRTAYMALDYIEGRELLEAIEEGTVGKTPEETVALLDTMLDTVGYIHAEGVLHRDISPDNILIKKDNTPVLIDFGAARAQIKLSEKARTQLLAVKDGYSPQEFYISGTPQSPASDLYALAATFYHLITGEAPVNSDERLAAAAAQTKDPLAPIIGRVKNYDRKFLEAIDKSLKVFPKDRFQSAAEWHAFVHDAPAPKQDVSMSLALARRKEAIKNTSKIRRLERPELLGSGAPHLKVVNTEDAAPAVAPKEEKAPAAAAPGTELRPVAPRHVERPPSTPRAKEEAVPASETPAPAAATKPQADPAPPATPKPQAAEISGSGKKIGLLLGGVAVVALIAGAAVFLSGGEPDAADGATTEAAVEVVSEAETTEPAQNSAPQTLSVAPVLTAPAPAAEPQDGAAVPDGPVAAEEAPQAEEAVAAVAEPVAVEAEPAPVVEEPVDPLADAPQPVAAPTPEALAEVAVEEFTQPMPGTEALSPVRYFSTIEVGAPDAPAAADLAAPLALAIVSVTPEAAPAGVVEASAVMAGWVVDLPFTTSSGAPTTIDTVSDGAPSWMTPGVTIATVGGVPVSTLDEVRQLIRTAGQPRSDGTWVASFGVMEAGASEGDVFTAAIPAARQTALLNGVRFQAAPGDDGAWSTVVTESPFRAEDDLRAGDVLIAYMPTNETLDGPTSLSDILAREVGAGQTLFNFAVRRNGDLWVVSMDYATWAAN